MTKASRPGIAPALCAALVLASAAAAPRVRAETPEVRLPLTIERVWFKPSRKLVSSGGDLTISSEGLELVTDKKAVIIPLDEVYVLSYGKFKSDVDTDWSVLGIGAAGPSTLMAIRDGKKLGYGQRTREIYEQLKSALRQLGAAQFDVPPGSVTYEAFSKQLTLAIPAGWDIHLQSLVVDGEGRSSGTAIFSSEEIDYGIREAGKLEPLVEDPVLERVLAGELPAFALTLSEAGKGMGCDGFSDEAREEVLRREQRRLAEALGASPIEPFTVTPATVGLCAGFRARSRGRRPDGRWIGIDLHVAAHGETLCVVSARMVEEIDAAIRKPLQDALATLKFSVAR